jgi:hypothetical protein
LVLDFKFSIRTYLQHERWASWSKNDLGASMIFIHGSNVEHSPILERHHVILICIRVENLSAVPAAEVRRLLARAHRVAMKTQTTEKVFPYRLVNFDSKNAGVR